MIKIIEENILNSFLEDFKDKYVNGDDEYFDMFRKSLSDLLKNDARLSNMIRSIENNNKSLEDYIKDLRIKLVSYINHNQKLFEQYNQLIVDNRRLQVINDDYEKTNDDMINSMNKFETGILEYEVEIIGLKRDIYYYKNLLENISLITNIINDDSYKLDEINNLTSIKNSPYYRIIEKSSFFDKKWYIDTYLTVDNYYDERLDPIEHFINIGANLDYNPSREFNVKWYRNFYLNNDYNLNPLVDYLTYGIHNNRLAQPLYNKTLTVGYDETHEHILACSYHPDEDIEYCREDDQLYNILNESDLDDYDNYLKNPDIDDVYDILYNIYMDDFDNTFDYSQDLGLKIEDSVEYRLLDEDELFDNDYYLDTYVDIRNAGADPIAHYLKRGSKENRSPNSHFSTRKYMEENPNIMDNPLVNFIYSNKTSVSSPLQVDITDTQEYNILDSSEFFDKEYYLNVYQDVKKSDINPLLHFIKYGIKEHRNPKESVNIDLIDKAVTGDTVNKYVEYVLDICRNTNIYDLSQKLRDEEYEKNYQLLEESKYFDKNYYKKHNPHLNEESDAIDYYLIRGYKEQYPTSKYFSPANYLDLNPDLKAHNINPLIHFINSGLKEKRPYKRPKESVDQLGVSDELYRQYLTLYNSDLFDEQYYLEKYPSLDDNINPIIHYLEYGVELSLNPSKLFSTSKYLKKHGDIKRTGFNPLYHYLTNGINENRSIFLPSEYYLNNFLERYDYLTTKAMLEALKNRITIIVEYNEDVNVFKKVLKAIIDNTELNYELYIISDREDELLNSMEDIANISVTYAKKVDFNKLLCNASNDVVILDKNTMVTPHWLSKLVYSAYSNTYVAVVSALSNTSDILYDNTKKLLNNIFDINQDVTGLYELSKKMEILFNDKYTESIFSDTSCMYIKQRAVSQIKFNNLYEMQDKLYENGGISLTNNSVLVYNYNKSHDRIPDNLMAKYDLNNTFYNMLDVKRVNNIINDEDFTKETYKRRILIFTEISEGKVLLDDKIKRLSHHFETYILALDMDKYYVYKYEDETLALLENSTVDYSFTRNYYFNTFFNLMINLKIDLLYTRIFKQLYHPTNRNFNSFIEFIPYLEIEELHEAVYRDLDIVESVNNILYPHKSFEDTLNNLRNNIDFNNKKVVVYTAVTGSYDEPIIPSYVDKRLDYICFTDNPNLKSDFWTIKLMEDTSLDKIRQVRMIKILPHKYLEDYDYSIWIDTNFEITGNILDYINKYSDNKQLLAIKHEYRNCIYQEAESCIKSGKDSFKVINNQINNYKKEKYPENNGLIASGILFRNHHDKQVIKVMEDWFNQLKQYSYRDQLSFNYACWKNNFKYDEAKIFYLKNSYFQRHDHLKNGYILRTNKVDYNRDYDLQYEIDDVDNLLSAFNQKTSLIIEVNEDYTTTRQLLESIIKYTHSPYEIIIINNKNNHKIDNLKRKYEKRADIKVITNTKEKAYPININMAIIESSNDIVILDNNTIVTPKWLEKLKIKAYSNKQFGSVTPITNNDKNYKLDMDDKNILNNLNIISNNIEKKSQNSTLVIPSANSLCTYLKREVILKTGLFDNRFDKGYYADVDYSRRLKNRGFKNALDTSTFIYNNKQYDDKRALEENKKIISQQYPEYKRLQREYQNSIELKQEITRINMGLKSKNNSRKRILYAIHAGVGGTLHTSIELMQNIDETIETYLLVTDTQKVELYKYTPNNQKNNLEEEEFKNKIILLRTWKLKTTYTQENRSMDNLRQIYFNLLVYLHIDIVHIRHLIKSTLDLPQIAQKLKIPVILSFHDFYFICPSHNLIDDNRKYCGGNCPPLYEKSALGGQCNIVGQLNIPPARLLVHKWRDDIRKLFKEIDAFVTTSNTTYDIYTSFYPELKNKDFRVIEHGRDVQTPNTTKYVNQINNDEKIRIVFPGHLSYTKGYELIKAIKEYDVDNRLEYHYMGSLGGHDDLKEIGIDHGTYKRSDFNRIIHKIKPHFIGIFTICPETYCHTLTEGWASGIPIIGVDIGAVGERIRREGGGYLIENNPQKAYEDIMRFSQDKNEYNKKAEEITRIKFKTTKQMSNQYLEIYEKYL